MRAIITRYLGPIHHRPSRIKAYAGRAGSITVSWDYSLVDNVTANHRAAALALMEKLGWDYTLATGETEDSNVHVLLPKEPMAPAQELLASLKNLVSILSHTEIALHMNTTESLMVASARSAIAKAEGGGK